MMPADTICNHLSVKELAPDWQASLLYQPVESSRCNKASCSAFWPGERYLTTKVVAMMLQLLESCCDCCIIAASVEGVLLWQTHCTSMPQYASVLCLCGVVAKTLEKFHRLMISDAP